MINIVDLAEEENKSLRIAIEKYKEEIEFANKLVYLSWHFVEKFRWETRLFELFLSQLQKSLYLAIMSTIRGHEIQTSMMLRYSLEAGVLAGYGLHKVNIDDFVVTNSNGYVDQNKNIKDKAYKWIQDKYPHFSKTIKQLKLDLNDYSTHANIRPTFFNIRENGMRFSFFDNENDIHTKVTLWKIGYISMTLIEFFIAVDADNPVLTIKEDFYETFNDLKVQNIKLMKSLLLEIPE